MTKMTIETLHQPSSDALAVIDELRDADEWVVVSHIKPDGDTIGSAIGLARTGMSLGKRTLVCCADDFPEKYSFLYDGLQIVTAKTFADVPCSDDAIIVCVDTSGLDRTIEGIGDESARRAVINIDHHIDNSRFGTCNFIEPSASSTGEVIAQLMRMAGWALGKEAADALYVAMVTDNGRFSYAATSQKSHECAVELMSAGVSPSDIADRLSSILRLDVLRLWARAFNGIELFASNSAAIMRLSNEDFEATSTTREDTDTLVNYMLMIKGVGLCALVTEIEGGAKISIRSRAPFSAREVAVVFGGGGHVLASGCRIKSSLDDAVAAIKEEMSKQVEDRLSSGR